MFAFDQDGNILCKLELPEGQPAYPHLLSPTLQRRIQTLPDGRTFWLRGNKMAYLIRLVESDTSDPVTAAVPDAPPQELAR